jgi:hypothetical protein
VTTQLHIAGHVLVPASTLPALLYQAHGVHMACRPHSIIFVSFMHSRLHLCSYLCTATHMIVGQVGFGHD